MSASTSSYSSLLGNMWGPEGSEINERLRRLHELEAMRKEREAKRQAMRSDSGKGVSVVRSSRLNSSDPDSGTSYRYGVRRTLSLQEDDESNNYGGARPKMAGTSSYGQEQKQNDNIFSGAISDMLTTMGVRKPLGGTRDYGSRYDTSYNRNYTNPEEVMKNVFSGFKSSVLDKPKYESRSYTSRLVSEEADTKNGEIGYDENYEEGDGHSNNVFENGGHEENHEEDNEDDHGEEPKYFIERLKYGNGVGQSEMSNYGSKHFQSIPTVPPFKQNQNMPELVQPEEDILSVAQEISTTFGNFESPTSLPEKHVNSTDPNASVTYDIVEVDYDSSGDEKGKLLPVSDSFYHADPSEWDALNQTSGKLDKMQEFFTGESVDEDPNISRELDGGKVKAELEKSFSKAKTPKNDRNRNGKTPTSLKRSAKKETNVNRSKSPSNKLKSSESENESAHTSEGENDTQNNKYSTPRKPISGNSAKKNDKNGMSLSDKLAKLESLTQEKKRKQSLNENETKRPLPGYMSGTNASQNKRSRVKDASPKPSRDLKKDVRELKQFVRQHSSEPNTPVTSPTKQFKESQFTENERKSTREISVQTDFVIDFPDIQYVCKHCGKSSFEEVASPLTKENLKKTFDKKTKSESPDGEKAKVSENKFSSKDSVKSLGETSTKSERSYRYRPKVASGTQGYMKGTTSSRLKNTSSTLSTADGKARKGSAPDIVHLADSESVRSSPSLKGMVSQKTKAIESASKKEKNKPALSVFKGSSIDREKSQLSQKGQFAKSKSLDQVNVIRKEEQDPAETEKEIKEKAIIQKESPQVSNVPPSPGEKRTYSRMKQKAPSPVRSEPPVEKLDLSSLDSPRSQALPQSPMSQRKPPPASPRVKNTPSMSPRSPRSETPEVFYDTVESKGQFTTLDDNPFIKNDVRRRNSLKGREKGESVWEKAESRSRDSSLKRSNSTSAADRERPGSASSLKRHNTSAGEKSSVSELTWSDSWSTGSLRGSKSSLHGSNTSLNREGRSAFSRPRSVSNSSVTSQTSQNAMLNLLTPMGTTRHPVSGAMETDVDVAYIDHVKEKAEITKADEHNEDSVNRAHLEFAKKACDLLEFEIKKRDSSNESDRDNNRIDDNKENNYKNVNGGDSHSLVNGTDSGKKEKGKKGFLKGKLFKK